MTLLYRALSPDKSWMEAARSWMRTSRWKFSNCPLQEAPAPPSGTAFENTTKPGVPAPIPPTVIRVFCALDGFTGPKAAGRLFPPASLLRRAWPADVRNHSSSFLTLCREDPCQIIVRRHDFSAPAASLRSALRTRCLCGEPFFRQGRRQTLRRCLRWKGLGPRGREMEANKPFAGDAVPAGFR